MVGSASLAANFWDLYVISNEHNLTITEIWGGSQLKISFRRYLGQNLSNKWFGLTHVA